MLEHRDRMLRTDAADRALASRCPERHAELAAMVDAEVLAQAARQIVLYHLDRGWADHLATLAGVREGIHLRALGHGPNPLSEFHAEAVPLYHRLPARRRSNLRRRSRRYPSRLTVRTSPRWACSAPQPPGPTWRGGQPVRHRHRPGPAAAPAAWCVARASDRG